MANTTVKDIIWYMYGTARGHGVRWVDSTILLYALRWSNSEAGSILYHQDAFEDREDVYRLMERYDNEPLKEGEKPRFTPTALRLVEYVNSPLALLRAIQRTDCDGRGLPASAGRNDVFGDVGERRLHPKTGLYNIVKPQPVLYACMHLYASGDAYRKSPEKARKPLYIKEKIKFLSLVCIVCINIWGFFPFSRILYKGMMHTMHTRPRTTPGTLEPSRIGKKRCMHPRMHTDAYSPAGMHTRPGPHARGRIPGGMEYEIHATRDGAYGPVDYTTPLPGGLTFADMLAATRAAADTTGWPATLVDDEGEPVLTIESDIMVFDRAPCPV